MNSYFVLEPLQVDDYVKVIHIDPKIGNPETETERYVGKVGVVGSIHRSDEILVGVFLFLNASTDSSMIDFAKQEVQKITKEEYEYESSLLAVMG